MRPTPIPLCPALPILVILLLCSIAATTGSEPINSCTLVPDDNWECSCDRGRGDPCYYDAKLHKCMRNAVTEASSHACTNETTPAAKQACADKIGSPTGFITMALGILSVDAQRAIACSLFKCIRMPGPPQNQCYSAADKKWIVCETARCQVGFISMDV